MSFYEAGITDAITLEWKYKSRSRYHTGKQTFRLIVRISQKYHTCIWKYRGEKKDKVEQIKNIFS